MPCLEIAERMIQVAPAITRVVDQLLSLDLISKTQSNEDRRVYTIELKPEALRLLATLDQPILDTHASLMKCVKKADLKLLIQTLEAVRAAVDS